MRCVEAAPCNPPARGRFAGEARCERPIIILAAGWRKLGLYPTLPLRSRPSVILSQVQRRWSWQPPLSAIVEDARTRAALRPRLPEHRVGGARDVAQPVADAG